MNWSSIYEKQAAKRGQKAKNSGKALAEPIPAERGPLSIKTNRKELNARQVYAIYK